MKNESDVMLAAVSWAVSALPPASGRGDGKSLCALKIRPNYRLRRFICTCQFIIEKRVCLPARTKTGAEALSAAVIYRSDHQRRHHPHQYDRHCRCSRHPPELSAPAHELPDSGKMTSFLPPPSTAQLTGLKNRELAPQMIRSVGVFAGIVSCFPPPPLGEGPGRRVDIIFMLQNNNWRS